MASQTKFGVFTVLGRKRADGQTLFLCVCPYCKSEKWKPKRDAERGKSCGCKTKELLRAARTIHGHSHVRGRRESYTYRTWSSMMQRCFYRPHKSYKDYGGRGITVCKRWRSFASFLEDMGERPKGFIIGRADNDGNYEPSNCRWETPKEQAQNRRNNKWLTLHGIKMTLGVWADEIGITSDAIGHRLSNGWTVREALTLPAKRQKNSRSTFLTPLS